MKDKKIQKIKKIIELSGWSIYEDEEGFDLSQFSPEGEDFSFYVNKNNIINEVKEYSEYFDIEEHATMWYGVNNGEPKSIKTLLKDAEDIKKMLKKLAKKLATISPDHNGGQV